MAELFRDKMDDLSPSKLKRSVVRPAKEPPMKSLQQRQMRKTVGSQVCATFKFKLIQNWIVIVIRHFSPSQKVANKRIVLWGSASYKMNRGPLQCTCYTKYSPTVNVMWIFSDLILGLTLSLPAYHCRQWNSWRIYASPVAKGLNLVPQWNSEFT